MKFETGESESRSVWHCSVVNNLFLILRRLERPPHPTRGESTHGTFDMRDGPG
jgi:hypothetical protein